MPSNSETSAAAEKYLIVEQVNCQPQKVVEESGSQMFSHYARYHPWLHNKFCIETLNIS